MNPAQMLAHRVVALKNATSDRVYEQKVMGKLLGPLFR